MKLLWGASESINVKGAYFEVLSDMLGSLGVIVAAVVVLLTGWTLVNVALIEKRLLELPAVTAVHYLHVWTITSGLDAISCHLVIDDTGRSSDALATAQAILRKDLN